MTEATLGRVPQGSSKLYTRRAVIAAGLGGALAAAGGIGAMATLGENNTPSGKNNPALISDGATPTVEGHLAELVRMTPSPTTTETPLINTRMIDTSLSTEAEFVGQPFYFIGYDSSFKYPNGWETEIEATAEYANVYSFTGETSENNIPTKLYVYPKSIESKYTVEDRLNQMLLESGFQIKTDKVAEREVDGNTAYAIITVRDGIETRTVLFYDINGYEWIISLQHDANHALYSQENELFDASLSSFNRSEN